MMKTLATRGAELEVSPGTLTKSAADRLAALTARGAGASSAMIHLADGPDMRMIGCFGVPAGFKALFRVPISSTLAGLVFHLGFPVVVRDVDSDPRVAPDAPIRTVELKSYAGFPVRDPHGDVVGVCAVMDRGRRDWTPGELAAVDDGAQACTAFVAERQARESEREQSHFLDALLNSLDTGVAACDGDGRLVVVNRSLSDRLGADYRGATAQEWAAATNVDADPITRALHGKQVRGAEQTVATADGASRLFKINAHPITDERGRRLGAVSVFHDITAARRATELQAALGRAKDEYLSLIGHELRTPLTIIASYLDLIGEGDPDAPLAESLAMVSAARRGSERLRRLVEALLDLSALDSGRTALRREDTDLALLAAAAMRPVLARAAAKEIQVVERLPETLPVRGDPGRLIQLLSILLDNAVVYTPSGGTITITLTATGDSARLEVADTGFGIPEHERDHIFERFFRGAIATELSIPGAGLGLATARLITERHHGTIALVPGASRTGTTLRVTLPR